MIELARERDSAVAVAERIDQLAFVAEEEHVPHVLHPQPGQRLARPRRGHRNDERYLRERAAEPQQERMDDQSTEAVRGAPKNTCLWC